MNLNSKEWYMMNGFYEISEWLMRFTIINLVWLIFNLPIALIIIAMTYVQDVFAFIILLIFILVLAPFLFFPSTTAMFASTRDWVLEKEEQNLIKGFLKHYKFNFKKSMLLGGFLTVLWAIWGGDIYYLIVNNSIVFVPFLALGAILLVFTTVLFSVLVHFNVKLKQVIKKTFLITFGSPVLFLVVLLTSIVSFYVVFRAPLFLVIFVFGTLHAFLNYSAFHKFYLKISYKNL